MKKHIFQSYHLRIISALVLAGALFCGSFAAAVLPASAGSKEARQKLADLERQAKETQSAIDSAVSEKSAAEGRAAAAAEKASDAASDVSKYEGLLKDVQANISAADSAVTKTQAEMDKANAELDQAEKDIDAQYAAMKRRIAYIYENQSKNSLINIFFESGSIAAALKQANEVASLMEYDRKMLQKYGELKSEIEKKKADLTEKQEELTSYQEVLNSSHSQIAALKAAAGDALADASRDQADAEEDADAAAAQVAALKKKKKGLDSQSANAQAALAKAILAEQQAMEQKGHKENTGGAVNASTDEKTFLAACIEAEAGNQGYAGQVAVGSVIMNRVKSSLFPNTITGVITQNRQFSSYSSGMVNYYVKKGPNASCMKAAEAVIGGTRSGDWLFFMTKAAADRYGIAEYQQIGDHVFFYKWKVKSKEPEKTSQPAEQPATETPADATDGDGQ